MLLEDLGYLAIPEKLRTNPGTENLETGRVVAEHKERYIVLSTNGEFEAEITGNMRFTARSREDFPAVGDWVGLMTYDAGFAIIHKILPRYSLIKRQAVDQSGEIQIIAANIDVAFIIQAVDRDFNINRLERYLTICHSAKVNPVIILSKTDLIDARQLNEITEGIRPRIENVPVIAVSNETKNGYSDLNKMIEKGKTYCMLGSSGVGKSTLLNNLAGSERMKTGNISQSTNKGKHVTSHRQLFILEGGGLLIDNPGMREVGIADTSNGLEITFDKIFDLSKNCRFADCRHINETGCAVLEALKNGELDSNTYHNFLKMEREKTHFASTVAEKRKREKEFGKILKDYYKKDIKQKRH
ncbi:MAG: ribosome small subunit-dependent GTPase A [Bacteroidales bacterium]|nr:ribosome small subunit-dependent GTPase A [Bacteroidales bacterium]